MLGWMSHNLMVVMLELLLAQTKVSSSEMNALLHISLESQGNMLLTLLLMIRVRLMTSIRESKNNSTWTHLCHLLLQLLYLFQVQLYAVYLLCAFGRKSGDATNDWRNVLNINQNKNIIILMNKVSKYSRTWRSSKSRSNLRTRTNLKRWRSCFLIIFRIK
jgi:hypothetical protein